MDTGEKNEKDSDFCKVCGMDLDKNGDCADCTAAAMGALNSIKKKDDDDDDVYDRRERR